MGRRQPWKYKREKHSRQREKWVWGSELCMSPVCSRNQVSNLTVKKQWDKIEPEG